MPQAVCRNTTSKAIRGVPTAIAGVIPAEGAATRKLFTGSEPVFEFIKSHKVANARYLKAASKLDKAEMKITTKEGADIRHHHQLSLTSTNPKYLLNNAYFLGDNDDIHKHVQTYLQRAADAFGPRTAARVKGLQKYAERELRSLLRTHVDAHFKRRQEVGLTTLVQARDVAEAAAARAMWRLCRVRPRTEAGYKAMMEYLGEEFMVPTFLTALAIRGPKASKN